jgi:arginase
MIGVPFDGMGRSPGQAGAPRALRAAGLPAVFGPGAAMEPDLVLPSPVPQRAAGSGLLNERALLQMAGALHRQVRASLSAGRFPFVYGADCSVLLAAVPALRDVAGRAGLLFVDGHEDATPMDLSLSGEAANMEIALLLGLTGERAPQPLRGWLPALTLGAIAMLGPRDHLFRQAANVPTVADRVWLRSADEVSADPQGYARMAIEHVAAHASRWWLHIDLDVLARSDFTACGAPGEVSLAGGLTWRQLTQISASALQDGGCAGWSISIYNPDLDPDRSTARRIVEFVAQVAPFAGR